MIKAITPSPRKGIGVTSRRPGPGLNPLKGDVAPNLPALRGTLAPSGQGGGQSFRIMARKMPSLRLIVTGYLDTSIEKKLGF